MPKPATKKTLSYLGQGLLFLAIIYGITLWQTKDMLAENSPAPAFTMTTLSGETKNLSDSSGNK